MQAFPQPTMVKQLQTYVGLLGYWQVFIIYLVQLLQPLYQLFWNGATWNWTPEVEEAFLAAKRAVAQAQTLYIVDLTQPFQLGITITPLGFGWGLLQQHQQRRVTIGFWSYLWKAAKS